MIPVPQTRFGIPDGNCWEACIASVMEIQLEEVPDGRLTGESRAQALCDFVRSKGWVMWEIPLGEDAESMAPADLHYLLGGEAAGGPHVVVARGREIVHNPNPNAPLVRATAMHILLRAETLDLPLAAGGRC